jgi:LmbE family N-acetylglucosaminyl deacetylase
MTQRAFAIVAHPDDIEFMMAGTLIRLQREGYEIHYMTVANGSCGSIRHDAETIARIRRQESIAAAELVGAVYHESLVNDGEIFFERPTLQRLSAVMREVAPHVVLTHPVEDYMEDHMNTCRLALTAAFKRGMQNFPIDPPTAPVDEPVTVYHALPYGLRDPLRRPVTPGLYVDIGDVFSTKREMLARHASQKEWLDATQGIDSYLDTMEEMSREVGRMSGRFEYAEGWTRHLHLGFCAEGADPLVEDLPDTLIAATSPE